MKFLPPGFNTIELEKKEKNKWRWQWLGELDKNGRKWDQWLRKTDVAGVAFCECCQRTLKYGSSGKKLLKNHGDDKFHLTNQNTVWKKQVLPGSSKATDKTESMVDRVARQRAITTAFISEHCLPFSIANDLINIAKRLGEDKLALEKTTLSSTSATYITTHGIDHLGKTMSNEVIGGNIEIKKEKDGTDMVKVKEEPIDPDVSSNDGQNSLDKGRPFSDQLKQLLDCHGNNLTLKTVLDNLLQGKNHSLVENIVASYRANGNNNESKSKAARDGTHIVEVDVWGAEDIESFVDHVYAIKSIKILRAVNYRDRYEAYGTQKFMCNFCSFETDREQFLVTHVEEHKFSCEFCEYQSALRTKLISHCLKEHHAFSENAKNLSYCVNQKEVPELKGKNLKKRKASDSSTNVSESPSKKKVCLIKYENDSTGSLEMEVEEVVENENNSLSTPTTVGVDKELFSSSSYWEMDKKRVVTQSSEETELLPVITNVISGHQAVSAATGITDTEVQQQQPEETAPAADNAGQAPVPPDLYWNCGYCDFVTLNRQHLKCHLFARHNGKVHKYVAMLVSSQEELDKIKASDDQLTRFYSNITSSNKQSESDVSSSSPTVTSSNDTITPSTDKTKLPITNASKETTPPKSRKSYSIEIDNAESEKASNEDQEYHKSIPSSYKCALCNFNSTETSKIKSHIFQRHVGSVLYVIDMKAVKLGQKRYVFLCLNPKCDYETKIVQEFLDHTEVCTPWLNNQKLKGIDANLVKSLKATTEFIKKSLDSVDSKSKSFNPGGGVEQYSCKFCSYMAPNNTRLKKHNLTVHSSKMCVFRDNFAEKNSMEANVYFCRHCLWETREPAQLELHLEKQHPDATPPPDAKSTSVPQVTSKPTDMDVKTVKNNETNKHHAVSVDDDDVDPDEGVNASIIAQYESLIPKATFEKAVESFMTSEEPQKKKRGRPMRKAAAIVELQKRKDPLPPLYECSYCNMVQFGATLIRKHLIDTHRGKVICANDVLKKSTSSLKAAKTLFCSKKDCLFSTYTIEDLDRHTNTFHIKVSK